MQPIHNSIKPLPAKQFYIVIFFMLLAIVGVIGKMYVRTPTQNFSALQLLPLSKPIILFTLDDASAPFTNKNFSRQWSLVFFGFTHCADTCPLELKILSDVLQSQPTHNNNLQVVFISLDPERDSLQNLTKYTQLFNANIKGVTGEKQELQKLTHFFGASYNSDTAIGDIYQINHSARIYLVNPQGQYVGSFPPPHNAAQIWNDLHLILKR